MIQLCCFMDFIWFYGGKPCRLDFRMYFQRIPRNCPAPRNRWWQRDINVIWKSSPVQAQELSYLFDFIDIDESGQVNKEDMETACIDTHVACTSSNVACSSVNVTRHGGTWWKEILFLETDSEARDIGHDDTGWHGQTHAPDVDKVQTWQAMCANPE